MTRKPTYEELEQFAKLAIAKQPEALDIITRAGFVFDLRGGLWEKLSFTLYTDLVHLNNVGKQLFEGD